MMNVRSEEERLQAERDFHNARFAEENRGGLYKYYDAIDDGRREADDMMAQYAENAVVLEYGCSTGERSHELAPRCKEIHGIDISDVAIEKATRRAEQLGLSNTHFYAMNAEAMTFDDEMFDMVFGRGIIHHLDLDKCFAEVARVLKPKGVAIFYEPLGHNPAINWYRNRTPSLRTVDEHPLLMRDFDTARKYFSRVDYKMYGLTSLAAVPFRNTPLGKPLRRTLQLFDRALFSVPLIRKHAWYSLIKLWK
jgi:SAM-dependent methyltransferase